MVPIIIVDYNSIDKTLQYIRHFSLNCESWEQFIPVIIDNSLSDYAKIELCKKYKNYEKYNITIEKETMMIYMFYAEFGKLYYCGTKSNLGYAKGNNLGVKISERLFGSDYYIICNNDMKFQNRFDFAVFEELFMKNEKIAIIGPKIVTTNGVPQSPRKEVGVVKKLFLSIWLSTWPFRKDVDLDYNGKTKKCYWVSGCFMVIKAETFNKVGMFDENTFLFAEEMILSERLKKYNYEVWFLDTVEIIHEHGATIAKNDFNIQSEKWSMESLQYFYRTYKNCSRAIIKLSNINYKIYARLKKLKNKLVGK